MRMIRLYMFVIIRMYRLSYLAKALGLFRDANLVFISITTAFTSILIYLKLYVFKIIHYLTYINTYI